MQEEQHFSYSSLIYPTPSFHDPTQTTYTSYTLKPIIGIFTLAMLNLLQGCSQTHAPQHSLHHMYSLCLYVNSFIVSPIGSRNSPFLSTTISWIYSVTFSISNRMHTLLLYLALPAHHCLAYSSPLALSFSSYMIFSYILQSVEFPLSTLIVFVSLNL